MSIFRKLSFMAGLFLLSSGAIAALGRVPVRSGEVPAQAAGQPPGVESASYTLHQTVLPTGTRVREFAAPGGKVFGLSWEGPVLPDFSSFFGEYFSAFQEIARQKRESGASGGALVARQQNLVVVSRGRMGQFEGHAYVPSLVPMGIVIETLLP